MHHRMPVVLAVVASACLTACGADDSTLSTAAASNAQQSAPANDPVSLQAAVTSGEQQQVAPVVHYPPDTSSAQ